MSYFVVQICMIEITVTTSHSPESKTKFYCTDKDVPSLNPHSTLTCFNCSKPGLKL